jgi:hypothetical protein
MLNAIEPPEKKSQLCPKLCKTDIKWIACKSDGIVLTKKHFYETNLFGRLVWEMCDGQHTVSELCDEIEKTLSYYFASDITKELMKEIRKEIGKFLYTMEKENLITWEKKQTINH